MANDEDLIDGGESLLIDVMAAAHTFRALAPEYFDILSRCNATFVKQRNGACMTYTRPHIQLSSNYTSCGGGGNSGGQRGEIVAVHWAPPFEGPLTIAPDLIEPYFRAYAAFELMVDKSIDPKQRSVSAGIELELAMNLSKYAHEYTWEYRLKPGEMIIFNNTRMLHGRQEFQEREKGSASTKPKNVCNGNGDTMMHTRHLVGAYTNIDDSLNCYRVILKKNRIQRTIPNVGNGTGGVLPGTSNGNASM